MRIAVFALCALLTFPALPKEREGVTAPPVVEVAGKSLHLMGMGLRKKLWFKVYLASFYLERPTDDGAQAPRPGAGPDRRSGAGRLPEGQRPRHA